MGYIVGLGNFPLKKIQGFFYRIITQDRVDDILSPAKSPEGRFHHDHQPTLYVSPQPDWAEHAIKNYVLPNDPQRVNCQLYINDLNVLDLRDSEQCSVWGADPSLASIPWVPEREKGLSASSWRIADFARLHAEGMIYTARSEPNRWHLVIFQWNTQAVSIYETGIRLPYPLE